MMMNRWPARLATALLVAVLLSGVPAGAQAQSKKPCKPTLSQCPVRGCAATGSPAALLNEVKRTVPPSGTPVRLTLDDFEALQDQADALVDQNVALTKTARTKLRLLSVAGGQVSEGDLVRVTGFVVGLPNRPSANTSGESVNCRLKGVANNDFHIPIARDPHPEGTEFEGIVVEMIPQERPSGWTTKKLKAIAKEGRPVLVRGQLMYDNLHLVNNDPDDVKTGQPKRFSLWEVHPVTEFLVCLKVDKNCNSQQEGEWTRLEAVPD